jgi:hypothetical protein
VVVPVGTHAAVPVSVRMVACISVSSNTWALRTLCLVRYSDSPNWKDHIETKVLPQLEPHVVTLNWSERAQWRQTHPFEARVFRHWAGEKEFNPMALIFSSIWTVTEVRLWRAFRDLKHGKDQSLRFAENLLFSEVHRIASKAA